MSIWQFYDYATKHVAQNMIHRVMKYQKNKICQIILLFRIIWFHLLTRGLGIKAAWVSLMGIILPYAG